MKFNIDIECTPEEARKFFGLPDVAPMQDAMMDQVQKRLEDTVKSMDPDTLVKTWFPVNLQGWSDMQKHFWDQMTQMGASAMSSQSGGREDKSSE
jgi:hypothetical protein